MLNYNKNLKIKLVKFVIKIQKIYKSNQIILSNQSNETKP